MSDEAAPAADTAPEAKEVTEKSKEVVADLKGEGAAEPKAEAAEENAEAPTKPAPAAEENAEAPTKPAPAAEAATEAKSAAVAPKSGVVVAGLSFQRKGQLMERAQEAGKALGVDELLKGQNQFLLYALLERHPSALEKMEGGVTGIGFGKNPAFPDTEAFYVVHDDGSKSFFSLRKAVDNVFDAAPLTGFKRKESEPAFPTGCVVQVKGLPKMHYKDVQAALAEYKVKFIVSQNDIFVLRFDESQHATKFLESEDAKLLCEAAIESSLVTGDAEAAVWAEMQSSRKKGKKGGKKGWRSGSKR